MRRISKIEIIIDDSYGIVLERFYWRFIYGSEELRFLNDLLQNWEIELSK